MSKARQNEMATTCAAAALPFAMAINAFARVPSALGISLFFLSSSLLLFAAVTLCNGIQGLWRSTFGPITVATCTLLVLKLFESDLGVSAFQVPYIVGSILIGLYGTTSVLLRRTECDLIHLGLAVSPVVMLLSHVPVPNSW